MPFNRRDHERRPDLREIAATTIAVIEKGSFLLNGITHPLQSNIDRSIQRTRYYAPDSLLSAWSTDAPTTTIDTTQETEISFLEVSTLDGARLLANDSLKVAILNFASAKKPGGGFLSGAQAQEESIARSSTLYPTLMTDSSQRFYKLHKQDAKDGYYSHAMIYSPEIVVFRDDSGGWVEPFQVDVLTSPAVNAGLVRKSLPGRLSGEEAEKKIERVMKERMGRILFLLEREGVKHVVLGSFGTGVFQNNVSVVAKLWADLLSVPGARFKHSFERVVFAILGKKTFVEFEDAFRSRSTVIVVED